MTSTPTACAPAKYDASGILHGAELNMTGEDSVKSNTDEAIYSEALSVKSGDIIDLEVYGVAQIGSGSGTLGITITKTGGSTATIKFLNDAAYLCVNFPYLSLTAYGYIRTIVQVTGDGTLTIGSFMGGDSTPSAQIHQMHYFFLKKQ